MIISSQQRFFLILVALSVLWLLMVSVQLSRVDNIYRSTPAKERIDRLANMSADDVAVVGGDEVLPEWAEVMLRSESDRKQFQRYVAARRAEERDVLNRMRELRSSKHSKSEKQETEHGSVALVQALQKHAGGGGDANASSESIQSLPEPVESEYSVIPGSLSEDGGSASTDYSFIPSSLDESMTTATSSSSPRANHSPTALAHSQHLPARPGAPSTSPALPAAPKRKQASFHGVGSPSFAPTRTSIDPRAQSSRAARSPVATNNNNRSSPPMALTNEGAAARSAGNLLDWRSQSARSVSSSVSAAMMSSGTPPGSPGVPPMVLPRKNSRPDPAPSPRQVNTPPGTPVNVGGLTLPSLPPPPVVGAAGSPVLAPVPVRTAGVASASPTAPLRNATSPSTPKRVAPTPQRLPTPVGSAPSSPSSGPRVTPQLPPAPAAIVQQQQQQQQQQPPHPTRAAPSPVTAQRRVSAAAGNGEAFHSGTPPFEFPPGDGSHENAERAAAFKAMLVATLSDKTWYRKDLPRAQAEAMLAGKPVGAFVVRDSSVPHCLALTHVDASGAITHVVLEHWDCKERRGWSREGGHTTHTTVDALLRQLTVVTFD